MFQKNTTKLLLSDGFIKVNKNTEEFDIISLPYRIYRDGKILDYHHFYYKFSKILGKVEFDKKDSLILIFDSSSFMHINYKIPEIDESEIKDFQFFFPKNHNQSKFLIPCVQQKQNFPKILKLESKIYS